jgi:dihydropteroate synthase
VRETAVFLPQGLDPTARRGLRLRGPLPPDGEACELVEAGGGVVRARVASRKRRRRFRFDLAGGRVLELTPSAPAVMGIVNATPDSFHDGDPAATRAQLVRRALDLAEAGADILDVGGESTRPGAPAVSPKEEIARVVPLIRTLRRRAAGVAISVDTSKAAVARAALEAGADIVNDVTSGAGDPEMFSVVAEAGCPYVAMHMRGTPRTMKGLAGYQGWPVLSVLRELEARLAEALRAGVRRRQVIVDPGIGFAKDWRVSLECTRRLDVFLGTGRPVLYGASRKSLLEHAAGTGKDSQVRLPGSLTLAVEAARRGAAIVRVHDVAETVQALRTAQAVEAGLRAESWA